MFSLTLIVLSQVAAPLVPAQPVSATQLEAVEAAQPTQGRMVWMIATPIAGGIALGISGLYLGQAMDRGGTRVGGVPMLLGAALGVGAGFVAGYFARQGSWVGRIASIALWAMGASAVAYTGVQVGQGIEAWSRAGSGSTSWLW